MPARLIILWFAIAILGLVAVGMLSDRLFARRAAERDEAEIWAVAQQRLDVLADRLDPGASIESEAAALLAAVASYDPAITDVGLFAEGHIVATLRGRIAIPAALPVEPPRVFVDPQTGGRVLAVPVRDWTGAERARLLIETSPRSRHNLGRRWAAIPASAIVLAGFAFALSLRRRGTIEPASYDGEHGDPRPLARHRMRFIAAPLIALAVAQTVALIVAAEHFRRLDMELAFSTIRRLGLALQSVAEPSAPLAPVSIASRLRHLAVAVPEIDRLILLGNDQAFGATDMARSKFDFEFAVAPPPTRTDLGFQRLLIHVDPWPSVWRSLGLIGRGVIIPISLGVLLAQIAASLWPATARDRRLMDITPRTVAADRRERAARKGGWLLFAFSAAMAAPWPILAQFLMRAQHQDRRAGGIALALCLAVEALAFVAGARGGAGILRRHGWRVPAMLGFCASLLGLVGAILASTASRFVILWALVGLGDGLARPALLKAAPAGPQALQPSIAGNLVGAAGGGVMATSCGNRAALIFAALILAATFACAYGVENDRRAALRTLVDRPNPTDPMRPLRWMVFFVAAALTAMLALRYILPLAFGAADLPVLAVAQVLVLGDLAALAVLWFAPRWSDSAVVASTFERIAQAVAMGTIAVASLAFGVDPIMAASAILVVTFAAALPLLARPRSSRHSPA
jgi:hypothetical protein